MRSFGQTQVGTHTERLGWFPHPGEMWFETDTRTLYAYDEVQGWIMLDASVSGAYVLKSGDTMTGDLTMSGAGIVSADTVGISTAYTSSSEAAGTLYWNADRETLNLQINSGVTLQLGEEMWFHVINQTGSDIADGKAVMYDGALGASGIMKCKLAISDGTTSSQLILGITTEAIANGDQGKVTFFGEVHGYNTSGFTAGDILYLDPATPGALTKTQPTAPNLKYGIAVAVDSKANGTIFVRAIYPLGLAELDDVNISSLATGNLIQYNGVTKRWENVALSAIDHNSLANLTVGDPHTQYTLDTDFTAHSIHLVDQYMFGFVTNYAGTQQTTIAFDGTNTFTLAPTGTTWSYYRIGVKYTITGSKTCTLSGSPPAAAGTYFVYIDATDGTLTCDTGGWTLEDTKVPVAVINWNNSLTPKYWLTDERHTCAIDRRFHFEHHFTDGTEVYTFPALDGPVVAPSTPATTDNMVGVAAAAIADEDLKETINALTKPAGVTSPYVLWYRTAVSTWAWASSITPYKYTTTGYIEYDNAGTMTALGSGEYVNTYLIMTGKGNPTNGFLWLTGQAKYANLALAQAESFSALSLGSIGITEYVVAYQFTWMTNASYSSLGKCRLAASPKSLRISATGMATGGSVEHNTLAGLQGGTSGEYYHLTSAQTTLLIGTKAANSFLVGPDGSTGLPTWRTIVNADLAASAGTGSILYAGASAPAWSSTSKLKWDDTNGYLGIGASTPGYQLHIAKGTTSVLAVYATYSTNIAQGSEFAFIKSNHDTIGTNATTDDGELLGRITFYGINAAGTPALATAVSIRGYQDGASGSTYVPGRLEFWLATDSATPSPKMFLTSPGYLGIGITPAGPLHVAGTILADGDTGGYAGTIGLTDVSNTSVSSGAGSIKMCGATARNSTGFIKIYIGTSAYYVPVFTTITG